MHIYIYIYIAISCHLFLVINDCLNLLCFLDYWFIWTILTVYWLVLLYLSVVLIQYSASALGIVFLSLVAPFMLCCFVTLKSIKEDKLILACLMWFQPCLIGSVFITWSWDYKMVLKCKFLWYYLIGKKVFRHTLFLVFIFIISILFFCIMFSC